MSLVRIKHPCSGISITCLHASLVGKIVATKIYLCFYNNFWAEDGRCLSNLIVKFKTAFFLMIEK